MPRKKSTNTEVYNKDFPRRLREVMQEKGETQQTVGDAIGKTRQAVGYYADGSSSPDWETIVKISKHFGVSTDYLLGLTDQQTVNTEIRAICDYTGLTEETISNLHLISKANQDDVALWFTEVFFSSENLDGLEKFRQAVRLSVLSKMSFSKMIWDSAGDDGGFSELRKNDDAYTSFRKKVEYVELDGVESRLIDELTGKKEAGGTVAVSCRTAQKLYREEAEGHLLSCLSDVIRYVQKDLEGKYSL